MYRFYIKLQDINNKSIRFNKEQARKLRKVLRMKSGDIVHTFDGKGWTHEVQLLKVTNEYAVGNVINQKLYSAETPRIICQSLPKQIKVDFILQKCTELGATHIIFFESEYSQIDSTKISEEKIKRWRRISQEATEQCGRVFLTEISLWNGSLETLLNSIQEVYSCQKNCYLDIEGTYPTREIINNESIVFYVGCEGGFSPQEKNLFDKSKLKKIRIGEHVLRAETAGMAFLAQLYCGN